MTVELVPASQWGDNLRSRLPKAEWDRLRKETYARAHHRCEICGGRGPRWPVEAHEIWHYDDDNAIQRLDGLIALCPSCHECKHLGRAMAVQRGPQALRHLARVNGWTPEETQAYVVAAFAEWEARSQRTWEIDLNWLSNFSPDGVGPVTR